VFFATPVILTVARMELPSTKQRMTCDRRSVFSLFILTIMPKRIGYVNHFRKLVVDKL